MKDKKQELLNRACKVYDYFKENGGVTFDGDYIESEKTLLILLTEYATITENELHKYYNKHYSKWTTEITINGELEYSEKLTIEQIEKLQKFIRKEL